MTTAHQRVISVGWPLRVGSDYRFALRRAFDHYHRGALSDCTELVSKVCECIPNHDADSAARALFLYANVAARRAAGASDDPATSRYLECDDDENTMEVHPPVNDDDPTSAEEIDDLYSDVARLVQEELGGDHARLSAVSLNRGILLLRFGRLEAGQKMLDAALAMLRRSFSESHSVAADAHHNLGVAAELRGDGELAKAHYVESLLIRSKFDDSQRMVDQCLVETMTNLAVVTFRFDGDAPECVRQLQRLVPLARRLPKRASSDIALAAVLAHLGAALTALGSHAKAISYLTQAVSLRAARLGRNHPSTVIVRQLATAANEANGRGP